MNCTGLSSHFFRQKWGNHQNSLISCFADVHGSEVAIRNNCRVIVIRALLHKLKMSLSREQYAKKLHPVLSYNSC